MNVSSENTVQELKTRLLLCAVKPQQIFTAFAAITQLCPDTYRVVRE